MNNNYRIFICTHKDIPFDYKKIGVNKKHYTILSQVKGVEPNGCDVIDISDDDFVKRFKIGYGELTNIHYLYTHQELIKDLDYIGICHYRRFFLDLLLANVKVKEDIMAIKNRPIQHTNYQEYDIVHIKEHIDIINDLMKEHYGDLYDSFKETMADKQMHHCNMVVLPKKVFLEYCEFIFDILAKFDEYIGVSNDEEVRKHISGIINKCRNRDINLQVRVQGLLAERLTDAFIREKSKTYSIHESKLMKLFSPKEEIHIWEGGLPIRNSK